MPVLNLTVPQPPDVPVGARNVVMLVLDSLRYDSWIAAKPKNLSRIGEVERRYSYSTWTPPGHYNLLLGLPPHPEPIPPGMRTTEYFQSEFLRMSENFQLDPLDIQKHLLPGLFFPTFLRSLGYHTRALVSMPVLNSHSIINRDFESYNRMKRINDLASMIDHLEFDPKRPTFYLLNTGETHYPYAVPGDDVSNWPRISGVYGVVRNLADGPDGAGPRPLTDPEIHTLRERQVRALSYVDGLIDGLFKKLPKDTYLIVTADHGELFGEDGQFGHGPYIHQKVLEVPLVEGLVPQS